MILDTVSHILLRFLPLDTISHVLFPFLPLKDDVKDHVAFAIAFSLVLCILLVLCWLVNFMLRRYLMRWLEKAACSFFHLFGHTLTNQRVFARLSHAGSALVLYRGSELLLSNAYPFTITFVAILKSLAAVYMLLAVVFALMALLDLICRCYENTDRAKLYPIRIYIQITKLFIGCLTIIFTVSILLNKSPWTFLAGLGALSAVLLLIFKDTILGFVSSVQATLYDIARVGDWITVPSYGVDGDVLEISINVVKVRNFDKTIVTLPTAALVQKGVKNWRGMEESGGRRIKRALLIDMDTIRYLDDTLLDSLGKLRYMKAHIDQKMAEIQCYNQKQHIDHESLTNGCQLSNIGLFRAYIKYYLEDHPKIHNGSGFTFLVRQLAPTEMGLPIELYVFTKDTNWVNYEEIQSDIFDHIIAALPFFHLRAFQCVVSSQARHQTAAHS